ncbi:phosphatidylserine decarboxylase-like protein proenzyme [Aureobasidium pullulans]|uniref:Phosphatidylserine decarboxylase proenzyme 1, mitochondrial n=1 Tax=Aureobasidium pullulans TaxID=5580 RepID=A0AB74JGN5_AURPU|nr:phosphatidylserine decarboxylase-like protein proenzyme [Aureobasidium pullulans]THX45435.1 phosphatidylserine decarboxylase-like protein proenzyme [Aureobasidium pullulans]
MASTQILRHRALGDAHAPLLRASQRLRYAPSRPFSSSRPSNAPFGTRLRTALRDTKVVWKPIPIGLGIAFLGGFQFYRTQARHNEEEKVRQQQELEEGGKAPKRQRIRPSGPWQVQIMSTLPLKAMSRIWGRFNELEIPYYLRVPGFKLYGWIFGVNFDEINEPDLHVFPNLASFFYRTLKPGARPLDPNPNALLSPADGKVIQFGTIDNGEVEQVKGVTYSLDALLGSQKPTRAIPNSKPSADRSKSADQEIIRADEEFAQVNGISYTLPNLFSGPESKDTPKTATEDQSTPARASSEQEVRDSLALGDGGTPDSWWQPVSTSARPTALYYAVIYLAPGDYHRFHSPCSWVVESRRHFAGELFSVSPYLQRTLPGLFTLNERVVLLGRWRYGFFSYTPVGATNVGSIKINFDKELRTNSLTTDTAADRAAAAAAENNQPYSGFAEATYNGASALLHGQPLKRGEEMGGFQLGSTIVLVFEAPKGRRPSFDEGWGEASGTEEDRRGGWRWNIKPGQYVQVGQAIGWVGDEQVKSDNA